MKTLLLEIVQRNGERKGEQMARNKSISAVCLSLVLGPFVFQSSIAILGRNHILIFLLTADEPMSLQK